jgi:ATP-dependent protease ClpP protease subunit
MSEQKAESGNPVLETFMSRRTVILNGEINHQSIAEVGQRLITLQARSPDRINLVIDSGGGSMDASLRLCDLMSTVMTAPVRGIALGSCGSAATFVMLYCSERISTPYSRFLIHSGTRSKISIPIGQTTSENLEQLLKDVKATEEMVLGLYMSRLTPTAWASDKPTDEKRREYVQKLIDRGDQPFDDWMSAEQAVEVGMITEIVSGKLDIFKD